MAGVQRNKERESLLSAFRWPLRDGKCEHVGLPSLVRLSAQQIAQGVIVTLMGNAHRQRGTLNVSWLPDITHANPKHGPDQPITRESGKPSRWQWRKRRESQRVKPAHNLHQ